MRSFEASNLKVVSPLPLCFKAYSIITGIAERALHDVKKRLLDGRASAGSPYLRINRNTAVADTVELWLSERLKYYEQRPDKARGGKNEVGCSIHDDHL